MIIKKELAIQPTLSYRENELIRSSIKSNLLDNVDYTEQGSLTKRLPLKAIRDFSPIASLFSNLPNTPGAGSDGVIRRVVGSGFIPIATTMPPYSKLIQTGGLSTVGFVGTYGFVRNPIKSIINIDPIELVSYFGTKIFEGVSGTNVISQASAIKKILTAKGYRDISYFTASVQSVDTVNKQNNIPAIRLADGEEGNVLMKEDGVVAVRAGIEDGFAEGVEETVKWTMGGINATVAADETLLPLETMGARVPVVLKSTTRNPLTVWDEKATGFRPVAENITWGWALHGINPISESDKMDAKYRDLVIDLDRRNFAYKLPEMNEEKPNLLFFVNVYDLNKTTNDDYFTKNVTDRYRRDDSFGYTVSDAGLEQARLKKEKGCSISFRILSPTSNLVKGITRDVSTISLNTVLAKTKAINTSNETASSIFVDNQVRGFEYFDFVGHSGEDVLISNNLTVRPSGNKFGKKVSIQYRVGIMGVWNQIENKYEYTILSPYGPKSGITPFSSANRFGLKTGIRLATAAFDIPFKKFDLAQYNAFPSIHYSFDVVAAQDVAAAFEGIPEGFEFSNEISNRPGGPPLGDLDSHNVITSSDMHFPQETWPEELKAMWDGFLDRKPRGEKQTVRQLLDAYTYNAATAGNDYGTLLEKIYKKSAANKLGGITFEAKQKERPLGCHQDELISSSEELNQDPNASKMAISVGERVLFKYRLKYTDNTNNVFYSHLRETSEVVFRPFFMPNTVSTNVENHKDQILLDVCATPFGKDTWVQHLATALSNAGKQSSLEVEVYQTIPDGSSFYLVGTFPAKIDRVSPDDTNDSRYFVSGVNATPSELTKGQQELIQQPTLDTVQASYATPPPQAKVVTTWQDKLVLVNTKDYPDTDEGNRIGGPNSIVIADAFNQEGFPAKGDLDIDNNFGEPLTGARELNNILFVFSNSSIHAITGNPNSEILAQALRVDKLSDEGIGATNQDSIIEYNNSLIFISKTSIYSVDRTGTVENIAKDLEPEITKLISEGYQSVAYNWKRGERLLFCFKKDDKLRTFVFNETFEKWSEWKNFDFTNGIVDIDSSLCLADDQCIKEYGTTKYVDLEDRDTFKDTFSTITFNVWPTFSASGDYPPLVGETKDEYNARMVNIFNLKIRPVDYPPKRDGNHPTSAGLFLARTNTSVPIEFKARLNWESLDMPTEFKKYTRLKAYAIPSDFDVRFNRGFTLDLGIESNYGYGSLGTQHKKPVTTEMSFKQFDIETYINDSEWGDEEWGDGHWGSGLGTILKPIHITRLPARKVKSMRFTFTNDKDENILISGLELEGAKITASKFLGGR